MCSCRTELRRVESVHAQLPAQKLVRPLGADHRSGDRPQPGHHPVVLRPQRLSAGHPGIRPSDRPAGGAGVPERGGRQPVTAAWRDHRHQSRHAAGTAPSGKPDSVPPGGGAVPRRSVRIARRGRHRAPGRRAPAGAVGHRALVRRPLAAGADGVLPRLRPLPAAGLGGDGAAAGGDRRSADRAQPQPAVAAAGAGGAQGGAW